MSEFNIPVIGRTPRSFPTIKKYLRHFKMMLVETCFVGEWSFIISLWLKLLAWISVPWILCMVELVSRLLRLKSWLKMNKKLRKFCVVASINLMEHFNKFLKSTTSNRIVQWSHKFLVVFLIELNCGLIGIIIAMHEFHLIRNFH